MLVCGKDYAQEGSLTPPDVNDELQQSEDSELGR